MQRYAVTFLREFSQDQNLMKKFFYARSAIHCGEIVRRWLGSHNDSTKYTITLDK